MGASKNKVSTTVSNGENNVPSADSTANALARDVIGNKLDTVSGDSLVAITKDTNTVTDEIKVVVDDTNTVVDNTNVKVTCLNERFHGYGKWFGKHPAQSDENRIFARMNGVTSHFVLTAGNTAFGNWVQIVGATDTPILASNTKFSLHKILVTTTNSTAVYIIQIVAGESADIAAKIIAEEFTEFPYIAATNQNDSGVYDFVSKCQDSGTKMWARCACVGQNATTITGYFGLHESNGD